MIEGQTEAAAIWRVDEWSGTMELISIFIILVIGFLIIGFIAAVTYNRQNHGQDDDEQTHIVISQEVPSVFDAFKRKRK